jgi:hypothetical protein
MKVTINDTEVLFPSSLQEITLGQRIDFYVMYGKELEAMHKSILEMEDELEKDIELIELHSKKMVRTFAFFAGITPEVVEESGFMDNIAAVYHSCLQSLFDDELTEDPQRSFTWKGEVWQIHQPELKHGSKMTFGELIDSKQIIQDMADTEKGRIESLLPLCAIYLRKEGEAYQESFMYEDSERLQLMRELPMNIALQVGFFLTSSTNTYWNTSRFSANQGSREVASIQRSTLRIGVG